MLKCTGSCSCYLGLGSLIVGGAFAYFFLVLSAYHVAIVTVDSFFVDNKKRLMFSYHVASDVCYIELFGV